MKNVLYSFIIYFIVLVSALCFGASIALFDAHVVDFSILEHYDPGKPSVLLDAQGNEWARFAQDKRKPVDIESMPQHLIDAFVAAEDHAFFFHYGISWKGIIRSLFINLYNGKKVQGASTITQQLIKLLFVGSSKTFLRKIKEQLVAIVVEHHYSKEQILQTYLNHVYFGSGIYGVEAASQRFWSKSVSDLTIDESAMLAGIVKSPGNYCPLLFPRSGQQRRNVVLRSMKQCGFISDEECDQAINCSVEMVLPEYDSIGFHAKEMIRVFVESLYGKEVLYTGGLSIQTTIDSAMQQSAECHFKDHISMFRQKLNVPADGALITLEGETGAIKAMVGGFDFTHSQFNRAMQAKRQIGSMLKPLVFAAGLEQGLTFADTLMDEPLTITFDNQVWSPRNSTRTFDGQMTRAFALSRSNNIVTIKTLLEIGCDRMVEMVKRFRLHDDPPPYPSLSLGCIDCTLKQACGMFNVFAQHGMHNEPFVISWIKDQWGVKIYKHSLHPQRIVAPAVADQVAKVLGISIGRAKRRYEDQWIDCDAIGKTGTTNDSRTCWFVGATPEYTTGIYIGCDDNSPLGYNVFGSQSAFPIWLRLYKDITFQKKHFTYDQSLELITVHSKTGEPVMASDPEALTILVPRKK